MILGLVFDLDSFVNLLLAVLAGGVFTLLVARCYFLRARKENMAVLQQVREEYTTMLRAFAVVQEQLAERQLFMRDEDGQLDPSMAYKITGKGHGTLPMLEGHGKGTVGQKNDRDLNRPEAR